MKHLTSCHVLGGVYRGLRMSFCDNSSGRALIRLIRARGVRSEIGDAAKNQRSLPPTLPTSHPHITHKYRTRQTTSHDLKRDPTRHCRHIA